MNFGDFVAAAQQRGELVVQPRMGFGDPAVMRAGLVATKAAAGLTIGTITLDSYTRVGDHLAATRALLSGSDLNGYPLIAHGAETTRAILEGVQKDGFPVQVRHGSADPLSLVAVAADAGLTATEGGPVSYCLPYSRTPLCAAVRNWAVTCERLASARAPGVEPHLESFGGCMLGQLCPPSMLVAISLLEGLFFRQHGLRSMSLSYAQQTSPQQDREALKALHRLISELLAGVDCHVVLYTYMGVYPRTPAGARRLLAASVELATGGGAARLIVKTVAEAYRIPTIAENIDALELAAKVDVAYREGAWSPAGADDEPTADDEVYTEARAIIDAVLDLDENVGAALVKAFRRGLLDIPYCLHEDNRGAARSYIDADGRLRWSQIGAIPISTATRAGPTPRLGSTELLAALRFVEGAFDRPTHNRDGSAPLVARNRGRHDSVWSEPHD